MQVAFAWLLQALSQPAPDSGTSSAEHLHENLCTWAFNAAGFDYWSPELFRRLSSELR